MLGITTKPKIKIEITQPVSLIHDLNKRQNKKYLWLFIEFGWTMGEELRDKKRALGIISKAKVKIEITQSVSLICNLNQRQNKEYLKLPLEFFE